MKCVIATIAMWDFNTDFVFLTSNKEGDTVAATLLEMETYLAAHTDSEDRYGLFS